MFPIFYFQILILFAKHSQAVLFDIFKFYKLYYEKLQIKKDTYWNEPHLISIQFNEFLLGWNRNSKQKLWRFTLKFLLSVLNTFYELIYHKHTKNYCIIRIIKQLALYHLSKFTGKFNDKNLGTHLFKNDKWKG